MYPRSLIGVGALLVGGCLAASPEPLFEGVCAPTQEGHSCLTLIYAPSDSVRKQVDHLAGTLNWGLYKGGDVGPFGPGDKQSLYGGNFYVDYDSDAGAPDGGVPGEIDLPDIPPQSYQALGYLDVHGTGESSSGDPVTLPAGAFGIDAGTHLEVNVPLDYVR